jgi:hypothetical protein
MKKVYNRDKRIWKDEKPMTSLKRPETCKGKKPHEFVLIIPKYISTTHDFNFDEVRKYYEIKDSECKFAEELDREYKKLGVRNSCYFLHRCFRYYKCSRCGKEKYE